MSAQLQRAVAVALAVAMGVTAENALAQGTQLLPGISDSISRVRPCVVLLVVERSRPGRLQERSTASGFFVSPNGVIATCSHVVEGADRITARLWDGHSHEAQVIATDAAHDVALVRIQVSNTPYLGLRLLQQVAEGMDLACSGYPSWGSVGAMTTTKGSITAIARGRDRTRTGMMDIIWTDAAINPGNSGAPVWLQQTCEVVGLAMATLEETEGMKLVTPVDYLVELAKRHSIPVSTGQVPDRSRRVMIPPEPRSEVAQVADLVLAARRLNGESKYREALSKSDDALKLDPANPYAWFERGYACAYLERWDDAITAWAKVIAGQPANAFAYAARGWAYQRKRDYEHAIADFTEVIRLNPQDAWAYFFRGLANKRKGNTQLARRDWERAVRMDPEGEAGRSSQEELDNLQ